MRLAFNHPLPSCERRTRGRELDHQLKPVTQHILPRITGTCKPTERIRDSILCCPLNIPLLWLLATLTSFSSPYHTTNAYVQKPKLWRFPTWVGESRFCIIFSLVIALIWSRTPSSYDKEAWGITHPTVLLYWPILPTFLETHNFVTLARLSGSTFCLHCWFVLPWLSPIIDHPWRDRWTFAMFKWFPLSDVPFSSSWSRRKKIKWWPLIFGQIGA